MDVPACIRRRHQYGPRPRPIVLGGDPPSQTEDELLYKILRVRFSTRASGAFSEGKPTEAARPGDRG